MLVKREITCHTEYARLKQVIVASPRYMRIEKVINETQKRYKEENINIDLALKQHHYFVEVMKNHGVKVIEITPDPALNEQVFTRDIGFAIGDLLFIAKMNSHIRIEETGHLKTFLEQEDLPYHEVLINSIEGGDVLIDDKKIWIGISDRTTEAAIQVLSNQLPQYQIESITLKENILHLDCTFNIIAPNLALVYKDGMVKDDYYKLKANYQLIHVSEEEQFTLGTNVLSIGDKKVISLPENKQVNQALVERGYEVIEVPFDEIIKSGGSYRCCTLPIVRSDDAQ
ncbi:dimethylarginine dimethylaminohydrolase family protein [Amphibacillus cookii]|uniref:dimethylarginine dimethylaminohydrolase family protein n=1 Tax=Amphibacillus cookii TaxID=767787 RepID=UPI00195B5EC2|nr:arginine deiminase family protein [Amphibacillus cookii]MBM7542125.1 N-dimethylarginine dimethylaminohydrolase [Amphibacillus cookii]